MSLESTTIENVFGHVSSRCLTPGDAHAIEFLASRTKGFSIPPTYLVWMLAKFQEGLCRVSLDSSGEVLGYILVLPCAKREIAFVWQLGLTKMGKKAIINVAERLVNDSVAFAIDIGIRKAYFTANAKSLRLLNKCLKHAKCSNALLVESESDEEFPVPTSGENLYFTLLPQGEKK